MTRTIASLTSLLAIFAGCGSPQVGGLAPDAGSSTSPGRSAKYSTIAGTVFATSCATSGCHTGDPPVRAPDSFDAARAYDLVGKPSLQAPAMPVIDPGNPGNSYLMSKLKGTAAAAGGVATRMPLNGPPLPGDDIADIESWIQAGAPHD
jgi:hypothetical protein